MHSCQRVRETKIVRTTPTFLMKSSFHAYKKHPVDRYSFIPLLFFDIHLNTVRNSKVPVMAHAHGADGITRAAKLGCRSIEHASFIDEEGINACLAADCWIVPTFLVGTL